MEEVLPGMVLARPIVNAAGMVVVGAGLTLDDAVIERLKQLGKEAIYVEGTGVSDITRSLEEQERDLDHRFRKVKHDIRQIKIRDAISAHLHRVAEAPSPSSCSPMNETNERAGEPGVRPTDQGSA